jgi:hypothetical protein
VPSTKGVERHLAPPRASRRQTMRPARAAGPGWAAALVRCACRFGARVPPGKDPTPAAQLGSFNPWVVRDIVATMEIRSAARALSPMGALMLSFGCSLTLGVDRYEFSREGGAGIAGQVAVSPVSSGSGGSGAAGGGGSPTSGVDDDDDSLSAVEGQGCVVGSALIDGCTLE